MWVEPGASNSRIAGTKEWERLVNQCVGSADIAKFLSLILPSVRSERGDTRNRHIHLHKTEHYLSNTPFEELMPDEIQFNNFCDWKDKLDGLHKGWQDANKKCVSEMFIRDDIDQVNVRELLEMSALRDVSELLDIQYCDFINDVADCVRREPKKESVKMLLQLLDLPHATGALRNKLYPYWNLLWLMDYLCYLHKPTNEPATDEERWLARERRCEKSPDKKKVVGATKACVSLMSLIDVPPFTEKRWPCELTTDQVVTALTSYSAPLAAFMGESIEKSVCLLQNHERGYNQEEELADGNYTPRKKNRRSANQQVKSLFAKFGIQMKCPRRSTPMFVELENSLSIALLLVENGTAMNYAPLFEQRIWNCAYAKVNILS